jgi:hypothetical protein
MPNDFEIDTEYHAIIKEACIAAMHGHYTETEPGYYKRTIPKVTKGNNVHIVAYEGTKPPEPCSILKYEYYLQSQPIIEELNDTGPCIINMPRVIFEWEKHPRNWFISQWAHEYTLYKTEGGVEVKLKCRLHNQQAHDLIYKIGLKNEKSTTFRSASTWCKEFEFATD